MENKDNNLLVTIYSPESRLKNPFVLMSELLKEYTQGLGLGWHLFVRNMKAMYRQTFLGYLWVLIPPVLTTLIWVFLSKSNILNIGETSIPYPVYVLVGNLLWQAFVFGLQTPVKTVAKEKMLLTKICFPHQSLVIAGLLEACFNALIPILILMPVLLFFKIPLSVLMIYGLFSVLFLVILGYAIGLFLTPLGLLYQDVGKGIPIVTRFWFFLTPVVYPIPSSGLAGVIAKFNPVTPFLNFSRDLLTSHAPECSAQFVVVLIGMSVLMLVSVVLYKVAMPIVIERMSS
jgi:lipopolysaccharide transport system permease protein